MKLHLKLFVVLLILYSCNNNEELTQESFTNSQKEIEYISSLGFNKIDIEFNKEKGYYVLEEDIIMTRKNVFESMNHLPKHVPKSLNILYHDYRYLKINFPHFYCDGISVGYDVSEGISLSQSWKNALEEAIEIWNNVPRSLVKFKLTNDSSPDVSVSPSNSLDDSTLAQASYPKQNGSTSGVFNINNTLKHETKVAVLVHELGHIIGFNHSNDINSFMYAYANPDNFKFQGFTESDITDIVKNYPISEKKIEAFLNYDNDRLYFFEGKNSFEFKTNNNDYTKSLDELSHECTNKANNINKEWGLSYNFWETIDAAVNYGNGYVYFFKENQYLAYNISENKAILKFPWDMMITDHWHGKGMFSENIDAAVNYGNGYVYFFKGDQYIAYDTSKDRVLDGYPKTIAEHWHGKGMFSEDIDAAVNYGNGYVYFFKGDQYVAYDISKDVVPEGYPKTIADRN